MYQKNLKAFNLLNKIENNDANFSHAVCLRSKSKNNELKSFWYTKSLGQNRSEAILETLTQEFYRLILPQQPKTRRAISVTRAKIFEYHVLSKQIPDFNGQFFLFPENNELTLDGRITGLAATQVLALWLNEVDFKAGNVGIDDYGQVIKIDGGLSLIKLNPRFKNLYEGKNLDITRADLEALPNLVNYEACNWLHLVQWNQKAKQGIKTEPTELDKRINQSPYFKKELYQTILHIISLPDELIQFFTHNYVANINDVTKFSDFIIARKHQLTEAANQIKDFVSYRQSNQAREDMFNFLNYLRIFKLMGKSYLLKEFVKESRAVNPLTLPGNVIQDYFSLMYFDLELDNCLKNSKQMTLGFDSNEHMLLQDAIISDIECLKKIIAEFLAAPAIVKENALYETLKDTVENYKQTENPIGLVLFQSINKTLSANDNLKKIKKPIPTPRKNIATQLPTISFFNTKHHEISAAYYQFCMNTPIP